MEPGGRLRQPKLRAENPGSPGAPARPSERREAIADATLAIIAESGLDSATIRRIAARMGLSTKVVTCHFATADDLHVHAYRVMAERFFARLAEVTATHRGDVRAAVKAMTPADPETRKAWRVYLSYWDRGTRDPVLAREHLDYAGRARTCIEALLSQAAGGAPMGTEADLVMALIRGFSLQATVDERAGGEALDMALDRLLATLPEGVRRNVAEAVDG